MKAHELLSDESKWFGKGKTAQPGQNCAWMAVLKCYELDDIGPTLGRLRQSVGESVTRWNDTHSYAEVHAKLKELDI